MTGAVLGAGRHTDGLTARIELLLHGRLPEWCDSFFAPVDAGDFFASRLWYETAIAHAIPPESSPALLVCGDAMLLPLLQMGRNRCALTTPYSLSWRPLLGPGGTGQAAAAGIAAAPLLRGLPPMRLDSLDGAAPGLKPFLAGLSSSGLILLHYGHFGNWHEPIQPGLDWAGYLLSRPPALRNTIRRKLERARRIYRWERITEPGPGLDRGIAAYEAVRARSWKPHEPFPDFDRAVMHAMASTETLRLGVLRRTDDDEPIAAQYWVVSNRRAALLKLAHVDAERANSPGTILTALMIRHLLDEENAIDLDFGRGDDDYKCLWVGQRRQRTGVVIADPHHPLGLLEILRHKAGQVRLRMRDWYRRDLTAGD